MSKVRDLDYYLVKAIRANYYLDFYPNRPEVQKSAKKTLAEIYAQLSADDPELLARVTTKATQTLRNFSWRV